jgi:hypothetical protein
MARAERPLEQEYPFLVADAMQIDVRRQGAVRSTTAMVVVGISEEGYREILGFKIALRETGESWKELFEDLKACGLRRVELAISVADVSAWCEGLEAALRSAFPGCIWQRCWESQIPWPTSGGTSWTKRLPTIVTKCTSCSIRFLSPTLSSRSSSGLNRTLRI